MYDNYQDDGLAYSKHCDNTHTHLHRCGLCEGLCYTEADMPVPEPEQVKAYKDLPCMCDWSEELKSEYIYYHLTSVFASGI